MGIPNLVGAGSPALYDPGEEAWPNKIHLGAGGIYLRGYLNVDIAGDLCESPLDPAAQANSTWIGDYYGGLHGSAVELPTRRPTIVDRRGDIMRDHKAWGLQAGKVGKVVCVQMFEHLTPTAGIDLLVLLATLMRHDAPLILSVPDMLGTLEWLESPDQQRRAFAIRHLYGSRRDPFNYHKAWYTEESLSAMLEACGFRPAPLPNFHVYPALVMRGTR